MARMRDETRKLRVQDAWGSAFDTIQLSDNAQMRLNMHVMSFRVDRQEKVKRPSATPIRVRQVQKIFKKWRQSARVAQPELRKFGCVRKLAPKGCVRFTCTSFPNVPNAFQTTSVVIATKKMEENVYEYRSSFVVERDHGGNPINENKLGIRIKGPLMHASGEREVVLPLVREYVNNYMFDLFVRFISRMRFFLRASGVPCDNVDIDNMLMGDARAPIGILTDELPPSLSIKSQYDTASRAMHATQDLCRTLHICMETPRRDSSSSSSSEDNSDSESNEFE